MIAPQERTATRSQSRSAADAARGQFEQPVSDGRAQRAADVVSEALSADSRTFVEQTHLPDGE